jgi:hypothetical protein
MNAQLQCNACSACECKIRLAGCQSYVWVNCSETRAFESLLNESLDKAGSTGVSAEVAVKITDLTTSHTPLQCTILPYHTRTYACAHKQKSRPLRIRSLTNRSQDSRSPNYTPRAMRASQHLLMRPRLSTVPDSSRTMAQRSGDQMRYIYNRN